MRIQTTFLVFLAAILAVPLAAAAQDPVKSFDQLNTRLKVGDTVWVTDAEGREIKGKIRELNPSALMLDRDGSTTMRADEVRLVTRRKGRPIGKGALWGLGIGAAAGAAFGLTYDDDDCSDCWSSGGVTAALAGLYGALGAGIGAGVGALIPGRQQVVYGAPGTAQARLSIAPLITPRAKGLAVSFAF